MKRIVFKSESSHPDSTATSLHPSPFTLHSLLSRVLLPLIFLLIFIPGAQAGPLDDGLQAYNTGDYQRAHDLWKPLAQQGDAKAQYNLALLYENGKGAPRHLRTAMTLYRAAAEQGYAPAQYNLGLMYAQGKSVFKNRSRAAHWWERAAAQNHPEALYNLGVLLVYGYGIKKEPVRALALWERSALLGYTKARQALVRVYESGEFGLQKDAQRAAYWKQRLEK